MGGCCSTAVNLPVEEVQNDATGGLAETYEVKHLLGSGSAGDTWLCRDRQTGELIAVKLMKRPIPPLMGTNIMREVKIGAQLGKGHLNIVKPRELILTRTHLGLVMEYVAGGNMADYILKTILLKFGSFDTRDGLVMEEDEARYFFVQIISAVEYCHNNKVAHRDLKMDNTLLDDNDPPRIKLCDFGFAKWWTQEPQMSTITGTPDYMSPQLLGAKANHQAALYDGTKADIWAAGVMLCVMLIGRFPFEGIEMSNATNLEEVSAHVWRQQNSARWIDNPLIAQDCTMLSRDCVDLLDKMFELDEDKRITIHDIKQHTWFNKPMPPLYQESMNTMMREQQGMDQQVRRAAEQHLFQHQQQQRQQQHQQQQQQQKQPPPLQPQQRGKQRQPEQVAAGAFVSKDRDAALKRMIYLAATRYSPEQEDMNMAAAAAAVAAGNGAAGGSGFGLAASGTLRKISLTTIMPYQYEQVNNTQHADLETISKMFKANGGDDEAASPSAAAAAAVQSPPFQEQDGQQQQHQQQQQQQAELLQQQSQQQQQLALDLRQQQQQQQLQLHPASEHVTADSRAAAAAGAAGSGGTLAAPGLKAALATRPEEIEILES